MRNYFLPVFLFISTASISGQINLKTLEEIAAFGVENNLDYRTSQVNVMQKAEDREGIIKLEHSSISATGTFNNAFSDPVTGESFGFTSTLSVPVVDQVSISGTINNDIEGQIGVTITPLVHSDSNRQSEIQYENALISVESARANAGNSAICTALNWMSAFRDQEAQFTAVELSGIKYNDDKIRYKIGELTLNDLQESLIEWSEERILLSEKQQEFRNKESLLYYSLGAGPVDVSVKILDIDTLASLLVTLKEEIDPVMGNPLNHDDYLISLLNLKSAESNFRDTWAYDPDLTVETNLVFGSSGDFDVNAVIRFSISPGNFQKKQRDLAENIYKISLSETVQSRNEVELEYDQILEALISTRINREISEVEYEQAGILASEAEILQKQGEYSIIDSRLSQLVLKKAENSLFKSLTDEYIAWMELKKYL